jgi:hypothetical protein
MTEISLPYQSKKNTHFVLMPNGQLIPSINNPFNMLQGRIIVLFFSFLFFISCETKQDSEKKSIKIKSVSIDNKFSGGIYYGVSTTPTINIVFDKPLDKTSLDSCIKIINKTRSSNIVLDYKIDSGGYIISIFPNKKLDHLARHELSISKSLRSASGENLANEVSFQFLTSIDSLPKFPKISDNALLDLVQRQTFNYFWKCGHPVSGMAREKNNSGDVVTVGGTGFGIMAIVTAIYRNFINRNEGLSRIQRIVDFLSQKVTRYHGAFPHWLNGETGQIIPFSDNDDGADLVETSYLIQGLLCAKAFFNRTSTAEVVLRKKIAELSENVEWNWFTRGNQSVLYWHWSPKKGWIMNMKIEGWNECLITYILAASSSRYPISKDVYIQGWAKNGAIKNDSSIFNLYYNHYLPLGPAYGGPLFFSHYSFLGLDPRDLCDQFANYEQQTRNHTLINYGYCLDNPQNNFGYSPVCWGLTASTDNSVGYKSHEPYTDFGVIAPTAAISSMPYTPDNSLKALKFFYYLLGDKIWHEYGFTDAFNLSVPWFSNEFLAIDQGPIIIMIENYRSQLVWNLFTELPEIKRGLKKLGFNSPHLKL